MAKGLCFPGVVARVKGRYVLSAEQEEWLREVFPVTENRRVARAMGVGERTMHRMAERLGLVKSVEGLAGIRARTVRRIRRTCEKRGVYERFRRMKPSQAAKDAYQAYLRSGRWKHPLTICRERDPKRYARLMRERSEGRRELLADERRRARLGLPQLTGVNVGRYTKRQICQRHSAVRRGYLVGDPRGDERMMIFWDGETERAERFERNLAASGFVVMADDEVTAAVHGCYVVGARD